MTHLWLYAPQMLACLLAGMCFVVGAWCCVLAADYVNNHSTVDPSVSGDAAASPGTERWAVGSTTTPSGGSDQSKGLAPASRVGVGSPGAADSPTPR